MCVYLPFCSLLTQPSTLDYDKNKCSDEYVFVLHLELGTEIKYSCGNRHMADHVPKLSAASILLNLNARQQLLITFEVFVLLAAEPSLLRASQWSHNYTAIIAL